MINTDWAPWKHLAVRYKEKRPRRMLSLDGGGIRGLIMVKVLVRLEELLAQHYAQRAGIAPSNFRLCQFFDYVAGTSTGAITAAAIARGLSGAEILDLYRDFGKLAFRKRRWLERWKSLYDHGPLTEKLKAVLTEEATLAPQYLKTLLLLVTRNAKTNSAWPISSNPAAKYNSMDRPNCNLNIPLWQIVRASSAAPVYFSHEKFNFTGSNPSRSVVFVDGGTTAYNNPAFCLIRMATEPAYRLNWERGENNLLVVSLGTGLIPSLETEAESNLATTAFNTLKALLSQASFDQDINCRTMGRCSFGHQLDAEIGDLVPRRNPIDPTSEMIPLDEDLGRDFLYARYNVELSKSGLQSLDLSHIDPRRVAKLDSINAMKELEEIGDATAKQVRLEHLGRFTDIPLFTG